MAQKPGFYAQLCYDFYSVEKPGFLRQVGAVNELRTGAETGFLRCKNPTVNKRVIIQSIYTIIK